MTCYFPIDLGALQTAVDSVVGSVESVDNKAEQTGASLLDVCNSPPFAHSYINVVFETAAW
jgi:hypothetical protein